MPSATHTQSPTHSNKKRRRDDNDGLAPIAFTTAPLLPRSPPPPYNQHYDCRPLYQAGLDYGLGIARKLSALPATKRARKGSGDGDSPSPASKYSSIPPSPLTHCSTPPMPPQVHPLQARPEPPRAGAAALLNPCHVCHRRPGTKSDVNAYADCQGCGQRTCYVCIRSCPGWLPALLPAVDAPAEDAEDLSASFTMHDVDDEGTAPPDNQSWRGSEHQAVVCSRCCVERGGEGDVVCLACLAGMGGS